jgi:hypothetical protein
MACSMAAKAWSPVWSQSHWRGGPWFGGLVGTYAIKLPETNGKSTLAACRFSGV